MRLSTQLVFSLWLSLSLWLSPSLVPSARACSCPFPPEVDAARASAKAVFEGKVVDIVSSDSVLRVTLEVLRSWKGTVHPMLEVTTGLGDSDCGVGFADGETYLVFADGALFAEGDVLGASSCGRTRRAEDAEQDIALLGPPAWVQGDALPSLDAGPGSADDAGPDPVFSADAGRAEDAAASGPDLDTDSASVHGTSKPRPPKKKGRGCSLAVGASPDGRALLALLLSLVLVIRRALIVRSRSIDVRTTASR